MTRLPIHEKAQEAQEAQVPHPVTGGDSSLKIYIHPTSHGTSQ